MTANDDSKLRSPFKDRLRIIRLPSSRVEHIESSARSIMGDLAVELNVPAVFLPVLAPDELAVVRKAWADNDSVRRSQKIVGGTLTVRDQHASWH